jgi:hypothetical protein
MFDGIRPQHQPTHQRSLLGIHWCTGYHSLPPQGGIPFSNYGQCISDHHRAQSSERESTPSEADIKITRDLIRAGQLLKIEALDHIVIGNPNHASLRSLG